LEGAAHDEVNLDLHLDGSLAHQQLRLAGIHRSRSVGLEALLVQAGDGLPDGLVDALERLRAWHRVVGKYQIEIDRKAWHVAHEEIDRGTALQRERVVDEHERRHARQQPCAVEIDLVHGFNTRSPSAERDTQGRLLPLGNCD
jgi:hypothetical protein